MGEPKNADGCIIALTVKDVEILDKKKKTEITKTISKNMSDQLDKYLHFSFRGVSFCIDTEERTASCSSAPLPSESISNVKEAGMWLLNVETSN